MLHRGGKTLKVAIGIVLFALSLMASTNVGAIVKGSVIEPTAFSASGRYSWLVAVINTSGLTRCTGILVEPQWVLTAGHCLPADVVLSSSNDLRTSTITRVDSYTSLHTETGSADDFPVDAGLVHLSSPLLLSSAPLLTSDENVGVGAIGTVAGWGMTPARTTLAHEGTVKVVDTSATNVLLTLPAPGDPCNGDSGGPLLVGGRVVGIIDFGEPGCMSVAGYSRVSRLVAWIEEVTATSGRAVGTGVDQAAEPSPSVP